MNALKGHRYRIRVEEISISALNPGVADRAMTLEVENHDDLLALIERVRTGTAFAPDDASALVLGLKLCSGVVLKHRRDPIFADLQPAMRVLIGNLKSRIASTAAA
jgi:Domain of Unknown Function with PDB structure (DUF3861)